jgi:hypothetical protein
MTIWTATRRAMRALQRSQPAHVGPDDVDHTVLATVRVMPSRAGVRSTPARFTVA